MITDAQKDQASLYALGALTTEEQGTFENELRTNSELRELALSLQRSAMAIAGSVARHNPPASLKTRIFDSIEKAQPKVQSSAIPAGLPVLRLFPRKAEAMPSFLANLIPVFVIPLTSMPAPRIFMFSVATWWLGNAGWLREIFTMLTKVLFMISTTRRRVAHCSRF